MSIQYNDGTDNQTISASISGSTIENNSIDTTNNLYGANDLSGGFDLSVKGKFYGTNAEYTGGTFKYDNTNGDNDSDTIYASGSFKAKR